MSEAAPTPRVKHLVFTSPYFLLIFLFIPVVTVACFLLHLPFTMNLLLVNNCILLVCIALRFVWYLARMNRADRYGAERNAPSGGPELAHPAASVRSELEGRGYRFDATGYYGEKRDLGYLGTVILYGGLLTLLFFGSYDNLRQYSGVVRQGIGDPKPLSDLSKYGELVMGPAATPAQLPMLQVRKILLPDKTWPKGAILLGLWSKEGTMLVEGITAPGKALRYKGFDYFMLKFSYDADLRIVNRNGDLIFNSALNLLPLAEKKGVYTHYGPVSDQNYGQISGDAWMNPEKRAMKVVVLRDGKQILDTELELWGVNTKTQGEYTATFPALGQWAEIRVAHVRHLTLMKIGAVLALLGGLLRLLVRPQRVWLEEAATGCLAKAVGAKTKSALDALTAR